jgi:hypothetical protein
VKRLIIITSASLSAAYWLVARPWLLHWGATRDEVAAELPGDEFVPAPKTDTTRAITIDAPIRDVWPWLAQIGQRRGGFYSYSWLENLAGCDMKNADRIVPEWQQAAVGDKVYLHPRVALTVAAVERDRYIVLERDWSFHLHAIDRDHTRLIVRSRGYYEFPDLKLPPLNFLYWRLFFEPGHFIMERKMMLGIKERAERLASREREKLASGTGIT